MKKVAILTITNSGLNFGNRLQNYALQETLGKYVEQVETIQSAKSVRNSVVLSKLRKNVKGIVKNEKRRMLFNDFNRQYIRFARRIRYEGINETSFADEYDLFVAGSDQVWNPNFHFNSEFEFAAFAPNGKRASYAASIGVSEIKEEHQEEFIKNVSGMNMISVRETDSVDLVKKLTGREAQVHIDPTMLLKKEVYFEIEEKPFQNLPDKYMLVYFLGKIPEDYKEKIRNLAKYLGVEIVELSESRGSTYYDFGPQHFLYAINHAEYICTDSFHGSVFSLLFHKQFSIFVRTDKEESMNSRIETLVDKFEIKDRLMVEMDVDAATKPIDYKRVDEILDYEREKSEAYIKEMCCSVS